MSQGPTRKLQTPKKISPCNHLPIDIRPERTFSGSKTGDYICNLCGKELSPEDVENLKKEQEKIHNK